MDTQSPLRSLIATTDRYTYLDHAAKGPLTRPAAEALRDYADDFEAHGGNNWLRWYKQVEELRARIGALIGAEASSIALLRNTSEAIGTVAEGFDWREGDNVVVPAEEFPSNLFAWQNLASRGVECRTVASPDGVVDLAKIDAACDARTRVIACSWIGWATGFRVDLAGLCEIAERHGSRVLIDGIQAVGMQPLDVAETPIDFLAGEGRKWLLGPEGMGYLYVRPDAMNEVRPTRVSWASMSQDNIFGSDFSLREDAGRFESGVCSWALVASLNASLIALESETPAERAATLTQLTDGLVERLLALNAEVASVRGDHASAIVTARFAGRDPEQLRNACADEQVLLSARGGGVRFSPHAYSTEDEIAHGVDVLRRVLKAS